MEATLGPYELHFATEFGPRITSLRLADGPEMFAELGPEFALAHDGGTYEFRGGHRLWAAPEEPSITYAPDSHECVVTQSAGILTVSAPRDAAGLVKQVEVSLEGDTLVVDHRITGDTEHHVAPWAITQFPMGGTAIMPVVGEATAPTANRYVVIWPYSSVEDRRVTFCDDVLELEAGDGPQLKFGVGPAPGRLGYFRDGVVFIKEIEPAESRTVPDFGAAGQVYVGQGFCELESVGGLTDLSDAGGAVLRERWAVVDCTDLDAAVKLVLGS